MGIAIGDKALELYTDSDLIDWINGRIPGYALRQETASLWVATLRAFDEAGPPMTVRQMYYALVSAGAIAKTQAEYNRVCYHLLRMRRENVIPYAFIADNTRWARKPDTWDSLEAFLQDNLDTYRRALWADQDAYVEVWCEKDALAGVLFGVTERYDVPLMVTRGYPSETFVYESAQMLKATEKPIYLYYLGDHDPSGKDIPLNTARKLRDFGADFYFEQLAVTLEQIDEWNLPTRPTKKSDARAKNWEGGSVELDAVPVATLRQLTDDAITQHIDEEQLQETLEMEQRERKEYEAVVENMGLA